MPADYSTPTPAERAAQHDRCAARHVRACRDGFANPDTLLHGVQDAAEADGERIAASPAVRAYLRAVQKAIEA